MIPGGGAERTLPVCGPFGTCGRDPLDWRRELGLGLGPEERSVPRDGGRAFRLVSCLNREVGELSGFVGGGRTEVERRGDGSGLHTDDCEASGERGVMGQP